MENKRITIGRDSKCDLVVEDVPQNGRVSGRHATITEACEDATGRSFILEDHSTNGTYVNSNFVHNVTYRIREGDSIILGRDYVLEWSQILPYFGGRKTDRKPLERVTVMKPQKASCTSYVSAEPVYSDPLPTVEEEKTSLSKDNHNETNEDFGKGFVFTGGHWLITIGAFVLGFIIGLIL